MKSIIYILPTLLLFSCSQKRCDKTVTLSSGDKINCRHIQYFVSGVSNIKTCDGGDYQINTSDIKLVENNK